MELWALADWWASMNICSLEGAGRKIVANRNQTRRVGWRVLGLERLRVIEIDYIFDEDPEI